MKNNYAENLAMLRKCRKYYKIIFWTYFIACIPLAVMVLLYGNIALWTDTNDNIFDFTASIILLILLFATGFLSVYKKEKKFTYLPIPVALLLLTRQCFDHMSFMNILTIYSFKSLHIIIAVTSSVILTFVNKQYRWLEQQDGFPYFNELFDEKKDSLSRYENNNPYQKVLDRYKNSSGKMDEI